MILIRVRLLARWVFRRSVDGKFLETIILFFVCYPVVYSSEQALQHNLDNHFQIMAKILFRVKCITGGYFHEEASTYINFYSDPILI